MTYDPAASTLRSFHAALPDFEKGTSTPRDFLEGCIEEVESREDSLKAFVVADWEKARQAADAASKRYRDGSVLSAIDGFPVGVKDIIETRDFPTPPVCVVCGWLAPYCPARRSPRNLPAGKVVRR